MAVLLQLTIDNVVDTFLRNGVKVPYTVGARLRAAYRFRPKLVSYIFQLNISA